MRQAAAWAAAAAVAAGLLAPAWAAPETGMSISLSADGGLITVEGETARQGTIQITVTGPGGVGRVHVDQVTPDASGAYSAQIRVGPSWLLDGAYTVTADQGPTLYTVSAKADIEAGSVARTYDFESSIPGTAPLRSPIVELSGLALNDESELGSMLIEVTGRTDRSTEDVTMIITSPVGNVVHTAQRTPEADGSFSHSVRLGGQVGDVDGLYTLTAQQGESSLYASSVAIDIADGRIVPEFGAVAALVLAAAVASIVAVTARSRLGMAPRL